MVTMSDAVVQMEAAERAMREAVNTYLDECGHTKADLISIIRCNRSGWSGGHTGLNVREQMVREEAVFRLERLIRADASREVMAAKNNEVMAAKNKPNGE